MVVRIELTYVKMAARNKPFYDRKTINGMNGNSPLCKKKGLKKQN